MYTALKTASTVTSPRLEETRVFLSLREATHLACFAWWGKDWRINQFNHWSRQLRYKKILILLPAFPWFHVSCSPSSSSFSSLCSQHTSPLRQIVPHSPEKLLLKSLFIFAVGGTQLPSLSLHSHFSPCLPRHGVSFIPFPALLYIFLPALPFPAISLPTWPSSNLPLISPSLSPFPSSCWA